MAPPWFSNVIFTTCAPVRVAGPAVDVAVGPGAGVLRELPPHAANRTRPAIETRGANLKNAFITGYMIPRPDWRMHHLWAGLGKLGTNGF